MSNCSVALSTVEAFIEAMPDGVICIVYLGLLRRCVRVQNFARSLGSVYLHCGLVPITSVKHCIVTQRSAVRCVCTIIMLQGTAEVEVTFCKLGYRMQCKETWQKVIDPEALHLQDTIVLPSSGAELHAP